MQHVVTRPREPFLIAGGRLEVHQILSWQDNLIWLLVCTETLEAAVVDGPEASGLLERVEELGVRLTSVLNTHTHADHVGINVDLKDRLMLQALEVIGPAGAAASVPGLTRGVSEGDTVQVGNVQGRVMLTEGHLDGHISFVFDGAVFCGDTLFAGGCGYLVDGPASTMFDSLMRLASLPGDTLVCCAHEYTEDNLRFAWSVEPDSAALAERIREVWALRAEGGCTVPSTIAVEQATNPFLRPGSETLLSNLPADADLSSAAAVFAATRRLKDSKAYKKLGDDALPLEVVSAE